MTLYATEAQVLGLAKETERGTAVTPAVKWYPTRGRSEFNYDLQHIKDAGIRGVFSELPPVAGIKVGTGKIPLYCDPVILGEFLYSLFGGYGVGEGEAFTVDDTNKYLDFNIGAAELTATVEKATYVYGTGGTTAGTLTKAIKDALAAADATGTYGCTYSRTTKLFTITRSEGTFQILWKTGTHGADGTNTNINGGALKALGYNEAADDTGGLTYTSDNIVNDVRYQTFTRSGISPQSYTFHLDRSLGVKEYNLCQVKKMSLKGSVDGLLEVDADILFKSEAAGDIGTASFETQRSLSFQHTKIYIDDVQNTEIKDFELSVDNGATAHRTLNGSQDAIDIYASGKMAIEGGFTIYFASADERVKFLANTSVKLQFLSEGDVIPTTIAKYANDVTIYKAIYTALPYGEDQGLLAAQVKFTGHYDSVTGKDIEWKITNTVNTY